MRWLLIGMCALAFGCGGAGPVEPDAVGAAGGGVGASGTPDGKPPKLSLTTVSGFAFDARTGRPLASATIVTDPPTDTVKTNLQGGFVIDVGPAFGRLTVRAEKPGYVQRAATCVQLKVGRNAIGDVFLAEIEPPEPAPCEPACAGGFTCLGGVCVSACNPACGCNEQCHGGQCVPDPDAPSTGLCGANAHPLGGGVCACNSGFTPAGDGLSCELPQAVSCPAGAVASGETCVCEPGLIPTATGDRCAPPAEAATVLPFEGATPLRETAIDVAGPRGLAFDGAALWVGSPVEQAVVKVGASGERLDTVALGPDGLRLRDLAVGGGALYVALGDGAQDAESTLWRLHPGTGEPEDVGANDFDPRPGLAFDGVTLASLEGSYTLRIKRRGLDLGQNTGFSEVSLENDTTSRAFEPSAPELLAFTGGRFITWVGTRFEANTFVAELVVLNAVHPTISEEVGRLDVVTGASHVTGLDATGQTLLLLVDGVAAAEAGAPPKIVEVVVE